MKTENNELFIEEIERLLQKGKLERVLIHYIDFFSKEANSPELLQIARVSLTQLNKYEFDSQGGLAPDDKIWNRITTTCWDIFDELSKKYKYQHRESVFSKLIPRKGRIQHNIPTEMRIYDPEPCKVRVILSKNITNNRTAVGPATNVTEEPVQILGEDGRMQIESVEENAFHVQMIPNIPVQKFLPKVCTEWTFYVTPKLTGSHFLSLNLVSDIKLPDGSIRQQVVYSITKTINVVNYPLAQRPMEMVTEGRPYVWKFPGLKYWIMWLLILLSQIWIPLVIVPPVIYGGYKFVVHIISNDVEEWHIKPDKPLHKPVVSYQGKTAKGIPAGDGIYKVPVPDAWKESSGKLIIRDDQFSCFGYVNTNPTLINCKCVKTPFTFIFTPDSLAPKSETLSITVDGDTLNPVIASRIRGNYYTANYYISDRGKAHQFGVMDGVYTCIADWNPGDVSNKVVFSCKGIDPTQNTEGEKFGDSTLNVTFITDMPLTDQTLLSPLATNVFVFEQTPNYFRFGTPAPNPLPDSFFVELSAMNNGDPCTCQGAAQIKAAKDKLVILGKCKKTLTNVKIAVHLEFDVSHPKISFFYPDANKIIKPAFELSQGGTVLKFKLPKQSKRLRVLIDEGHGLQSVDLVPDRDQIIMAKSASKKITVQLSDYFKKHLPREHFQIVDVATKTNKGRIDPGKGNVVFYEAKGKPQHWNIMWSTRGEGGTPANIKVAEIVVDKKGGHQKITCWPSSDVKNALGQHDSGKGINVIFSVKQ